MAINDVCSICGAGACHTCRERYDSGDHGKAGHAFAVGHQSGQVAEAPAPKIVKLPTYLTADEMGALLAASQEPVERLLILLCWRGGLRVSEALAVEAVHTYLSPADPMLRVTNPKGGHERLVPLHHELVMALRYATEKTPAGVLVPMKRVTAWRRIKAAAKRAGIKKSVGVHTLRHSAARHWLGESVELNKVQLWLGHRNLNTTFRYLALTPDSGGDMQRVS